MNDGTKDSTVEHAERLQESGRQLVTAFFMLIRAVKLYHPDNAVFVKPLEGLRQSFNQILKEEGKLSLRVVGGSIYLNEAPVKFELKSMDSVRAFIAELESRKVGGLTLRGSLEVAELKSFVWIFGQSGAPAAGAPAEAVAPESQAGKTFGPIELLPWTDLREKLQNEKVGRSIDPSKQALAAYARVVFFMRQYFQARAAQKPLAATTANRPIEELVDLATQQRQRFLTLAALKGVDDYLVFHAVNTALLAIAFGKDLCLDRGQLRDLGMAGLFHDVGNADLPESFGQQPGPLSPADRRLVAKSHLLSTRAAFTEGLDASSAFRLLATFEHSVDYGVATRGPNGRVTAVTPGKGLALYSRILSICCVYDALTSQRPFRAAYTREAALEMMWIQLRQKFDPTLLVAFTDLVLPAAAVWLGPADRQALEAS
jgi:hypothetical protein